MDQALKQRLVGASVLIVLGVVLLPMLLSGQPESRHESGSIQVPDKPPEVSIETRRFPIGEHKDAQPSVVPEPSRVVEGLAPDSDAAAQPTATEDAGAPGPAVDDGADSTLAAVEAVPAMEPAGTGANSGAGEPRGQVVTGKPAAAGGRYLVQVASFSNTANVTQLTGVLRENGLPVLTDTVETAAGRLHRVRAGPYDDLAGANAAMDRIGAMMSDLNPRVVDLRPDEHAPVTDPSDPMVRWVVQAGSFGDAANADQLVAQLRLNDFPAYTEVVSSAAGTVYKVRIGPLVERQGAVELAERLSSRMKIDGMVMSVD